MPSVVTNNAQALAGVDVFKGLDSLELRELEKCSREVAYPENKVIFREGEVGDKMFLILDGVVEIWKSRKAMEVQSATPGMKEYREKLSPMSGSLYDERLYKSLD